MSSRYFFTFPAVLFLGFSSHAQITVDTLPADTSAVSAQDSISITAADSAACAYDAVELPQILFVTPVYTPYEILDTASVASFKPTNGHQAMKWLERERKMNRFAKQLRQRHAISHPDDVPYNLKDLPEPPKQEKVVVHDPSMAVVSAEIVATTGNAGVKAVEITKQHWQNKLGVNLQFSQAYISPNWYQGGNSSLNLIADFLYNTNLNTQFHPNLLFENSFQWRTALASSPDDQYRAYSITENRLQINSKFGYRASKKWYYTITGLFKTPVFNSYKSNSETMTASFLSPGELNIGVGMTFSTKALKDKFEFNATISPLSYNLKTVINKEVSETQHGLKEGTKSLSSYGSSVELTWNWEICYNVRWRSRMFGSTNYEYFQADWQNSFMFTINKFLTANLNVDMRYDTSAMPLEDSKWHKFQLKELISLGFTYTLSH